METMTSLTVKERKALEDLIPIKLTSMIVKCQNAYRFYIHIHQQNVELLQQAENSEAKKAIILAEQKMLEVNEQQKKLLKEIDIIIDDYCKKLTEKNINYDRETLYGVANRLISFQLEKAVAKERQKGDYSSSTSKSQISMQQISAAIAPTTHSTTLLKPDSLECIKLSSANSSFSVLQNLKDLPAVINAVRLPKPGLQHQFNSKMSSNTTKLFAATTMTTMATAKNNSNSEGIKTSRMNLLQALKKAKDESKSKSQEPIVIKKEEDEDDDDEEN